MKHTFLKRTRIILIVLSMCCTLVYIITTLAFIGWAACFTFVTWFMLYKMKPEIEANNAECEPPAEFWEFHPDYHEELSEEYCRN